MEREARQGGRPDRMDVQDQINIYIIESVLIKVISETVAFQPFPSLQQ